MAKKFYVVWVGRETGIFTDWATTQKSVIKYPAAKFKSFPTRAEAEQAFYAGKPSAGAKKVKTTGVATGNKKTLASNRLTKKNYDPDFLAKFDILIYCDGGCEPNPGESASGVAVYSNGEISDLWYGLYNPIGTNNTAELNALYQSFLIAEKEILAGKSVLVLSDSMYSINCTSKWADGWKKKGWTKGSGEIKNLEIIKKNHELYNRIKSDMQLFHVEAHADIEGNELADRMSILGIERKEKGFCKYDEALDIKAIMSLREG